MGYRSDSEDVIAYETDNPFVAADGNTLISAHRSGGGIMPEETMMAFKNCAENENFTVDWFEFDLHITKDNVLVLLHDDTLDRTSDSETVFGEKKYAQRIKHTRNSECSTWAQNLKMKTAKCLMQI